jgi:hypothetical protein
MPETLGSWAETAQRAKFGASEESNRLLPITSQWPDTPSA